MPLSIKLIGLSVVTLWLYIASQILVAAQEEKQAPKSSIKTQRAAVKAWGDLLQQQLDDEYENSHWGAPQHYFDKQAQRMSDLFEEKGALVNFVLVGACDGTNDMTIRERYLPHEHWRGVFVEPFSINYNDIVKYMAEHQVTHRTHIIQAAATSHCNDTIIKMKRPNHEEKNKTLPHWMRRQIGSVVPFDKLDRPMTGGWIAEFVRCVTGDDILKDWAAFVNRDKMNPDPNIEGSSTSSGGGKKLVAKMRPHILKVDVEGHDYEVLRGFLLDETPNSQLPLLISFEAKSIAHQFPLLQEKLEARGYVVSKYASDGFAMLRGDRIYSRTAASAGGSSSAEGQADAAEKRVRKAAKKAKKREQKEAEAAVRGS